MHTQKKIFFFCNLAITCDPSEFQQKNYTLRQEIMNRETEIAICITMYNVSEILFGVFCSYAKIQLIITGR